MYVIACATVVLTTLLVRRNRKQRKRSELYLKCLRMYPIMEPSRHDL